jgi:hypothetical protein
MKFFDRKTEVMDIQLTQKGKSLLAEGKFKPKYYSFHDDNIIYDREYAGYREGQKSIEDRIKEQSMLMHTQHNFSGVELKSTAMDAAINVSEMMLQLPISDNSDLGTQLAPQWDVKFCGAELQSAIGYYSGSSEVTIPIPQVEMQPKYIIKPLDESANVAYPTSVAKAFPDGTILSLEPDHILMEVNELFTPFQNENFDIEVYKFQDRESVSRVSKLNFVRETTHVVDDILLEEPILSPLEQGGFVLTPDYVEYYFDVNVDSQISAEDLCACVKKLKSKNIYLETAFECPEAFNPVFANIYQSTSEQEICDDDPEPCE